MILGKKGAIWQDALKFINKCPVCNSVYTDDQAKLFAQQAQANLLHLTCADCKSHFIAMVVSLGQGLSVIGMVSDLSFDDACRLHGLKSIDIDELIDGRKLINQKDLLLKLV